jgi:hypothetical protein
LPFLFLVLARLARLARNARLARLAYFAKVPKIGIVKRGMSDNGYFDNSFQLSLTLFLV